MAIEIERKFLVNDNWRSAPIQKSVVIKQAYLSSDPEKIVRIRTNGTVGFITIKGLNKGLSRLEFEYEIPLADANQIIDTLTSSSIQKIRHYITVQGKLWEVDEFLGDNEGLVVAEIELTSESEHFAIPDWLGEEVSADKRYANSSLFTKPFKTW